MKKIIKKITLTSIVTICASCANIDNSVAQVHSAPAINNKLKVLIVDGQNNHTVWPKSTIMMKQYMEESGLFSVDVYRTKPTWKGSRHPEYYALHSDSSNVDGKKPKVDTDFNPNFNGYDVIVSNFGFRTANWPNKTQESFETYMANGGGFVAVHAANNAFPKWKAFNQMTGVGGWGGRNEKSGPHLYYNDKGELITDTSKGKGGTHGKIHELQITKRVEHPILAGLPNVWMHTKDECYGKLRGPAENFTIIATALCPKDQKGTGNHEPMLMTINYDKGRIFNTTLGHEDYSFESVGFITTLLRGVEWAATGKVTQAVPSDFPTEKKSSKRAFNYKELKVQ